MRRWFWLLEMRACNMSRLITRSWQSEASLHNTEQTKDPRTPSLTSLVLISLPYAYLMLSNTRLCLCLWFSVQSSVWSVSSSQFSNQSLFCCHILTCFRLPEIKRQKGNVLAIVNMPCYWIIGNIPNESWAKADRALNCRRSRVAGFCQSL